MITDNQIMEVTQDTLQGWKLWGMTYRDFIIWVDGVDKFPWKVSKLKNWGSWDFQIKIGTVSKITRESKKKRGQDDGQWLVNDWPTPTPHTLGGWQSQRPTLTQPVTTPTTLYIKKPDRNFSVMLKIFISILRNTLWRNYNSRIYSLHLILWLQRHTCKKRVMWRRRLFWPKKICGKSA